MNIVECGRCERKMIAELFKTHNCSPAYQGCKEIEADMIGEFNDDYGRKVIQVFGMDGITYLITKTDKEKVPIPFNPPNEFDSEGDQTRNGQNLLAGAVTSAADEGKSSGCNSAADAIQALAKSNSYGGALNSQKCIRTKSE